MTETVTPQELQHLLREGRHLALIDVREVREFDAAQIFGATFCPRGDLEFRIAQLVPCQLAHIVLCDDGADRAPIAAATLRQLGYRHVASLAGGVPAWQAAGFPTVQGGGYGPMVPGKAFGEKLLTHEGVAHISATDLKARMEKGERVIVVDVRMPAEYEYGHIPGALGVPGSELPLLARDIVGDQAVTLVTNCAGRTRSIISAYLLRRMGFPDVYALDNGTMAWTLAGFRLEQGAGRGWDDAPSEDSLAAANRLVEQFEAQVDVPFIDVDGLLDLQQRAAREPLYQIDVRTPSEYAAGHIPGAISCPAGQVVLFTDTIVAVRDAAVVVYSDEDPRSRIVAALYKRMGREMGYPNVLVLRGGLPAWRARGLPMEQRLPDSIVLGLDAARKNASYCSARQLHAHLAGSRPPLVIDVDSSECHRAGHIPGSRWLLRAVLESAITALAPDKATEIVLTCADGAKSSLASATMTNLGYKRVTILTGGLSTWVESGFPVEKGLVGQAEPLDAPAPLSTRDPAAIRHYLRWEEDLAEMFQK